MSNAAPRSPQTAHLPKTGRFLDALQLLQLPLFLQLLAQLLKLGSLLLRLSLPLPYSLLVTECSGMPGFLEILPTASHR